MAVFNEPAQWDHTLGNNADASTLPDDSAATAGTASLQKLFQLINATPLEAGGIAPDREDVNALFKYLGDQIFYTQNGGVPSYNAAYDYIAGRVVLYNGNLYKCIQANGVSSTVVTPGSDTAYWQRLDSNGAIGEIKYFAFNTAPDGYLVCNGASVSRETYADLFAVIGTTFGSGDGSTTFALPNLIDKFAQGSATVGTVKSAGLPNITGTMSYMVHADTSQINNRQPESGAFRARIFQETLFAYQSMTATRWTDPTFDASLSNSIYGNSTTVQPPALTLLPCIKY